MKIIIKPRQTGRTTELIKRCAEYRYALIVCPSRRQVEFVFRKACELGFEIPNPITFREFVDGMFYGKNIDAFLFDNLDAALESFARGVLVDAVVFKKCEEEVSDNDN